MNNVFVAKFLTTFTVGAIQRLKNLKPKQVQLFANAIFVVSYDLEDHFNDVTQWQRIFF